MIERFRESRVLVVGDVMLDRYWWGDVERISPEAPVPVVRLNRRTLAPGGAANVAVNAAGLGASTILIGTIGDDDEARLTRDVLSDAGIRGDDLVTLNDHPTTVKTRIVAHGQHVVRVDQESEPQLLRSDSEAIIKVVKQALDAVDAVIVSDYAKGVVTNDLLEQLFKESAKRGLPVMVDPKGRDYTRYHGAAIITPNLREALDATGIDDRTKTAALASGSKLMESGGFEAVLVTQGAEGMTLFRRDLEAVHLTANAREVYDVTGAGDTVIATLGVAVAAGLDLESAARLANLAAGIVVGQIGTTSITFDELRAALQNGDVTARQRAN